MSTNLWTGQKTLFASSKSFLNAQQTTYCSFRYGMTLYRLHPTDVSLIAGATKHSGILS
jgi:hypothetical protein